MAAAGANRTTVLEIVSPEKLLVSRPVEMVVLPAAEGELGVLPGHAPLIASLQGGVIRLYEGGAVVDSLFVTGGFAEVTAERCTVLADDAVPVAQLVRAEAERQLAEAQAAYDAADKLDVAAVDAALDRARTARIRLDAAS